MDEEDGPSRVGPFTRAYSRRDLQVLLPDPSRPEGSLKSVGWKRKRGENSMADGSAGPSRPVVDASERMPLEFFPDSQRRVHPTAPARSTEKLRSWGSERARRTDPSQLRAVS